MAFLELSDIRKVFGRTVAVEAFQLQVEQGEFVSFLGPSGCGKTTTLRMVAGFEQPSSGRITIDDQDVTNRRPNQRNIGMVFQSYALFPNMTVSGNIGFGLKVAGRSRPEIDKRVGEMLALIKLENLGGRYPYQLSGGQQQRVALARALAIRPKLLLLDEPLSALDAKIRLSLRNEIRAIQRQLGITTIYVTHDQEEALSLSDRVVVMNEGRVEQLGTPFEIYNFPKTAFVASFVGTLNQVTVEVMAANELLLDGQLLYTARPVTARKGERLTLAIRPELISLVEPAFKQASYNVLTGRVANISFLGAIVRIQIRLLDQLIALDEFNNPHLRLPGRDDQVQVAFPDTAGLILPD